MFFVYILQSIKTGEFYKGNAQDFDKRFLEHEKGKTKSTKNMIPFRIIHVEICDNRQEARRMEKFFKSGFGREIIKEIAEELHS